MVPGWSAARVFVALDVIVIGTVIAIVHVHGNDTVGVIGSH